ncbi:peptide deformylase [Bacillus carboniphilus]|uniref:Peptide deformylase n=1 Tax=Bacillus carboniphilus TaxID=86663 RepID=A0ABN0WAA7_9BACI
MSFSCNGMIIMKDIVRDGHPILREITKEVPYPLTKEDKETMVCMLQYIKNSQDDQMVKKYNLRPGVGLSANQIGLNKRMFAAYFTDENNQLHEYTLFNPKIVSHSVSMIYLPQGEGCLSIDRAIPGFVPRYEKVKIRAINMDGEEVQLKLKGYASIVVQHEMDHLNGILFYDRINKENPYKLPEGVAIKSVY